MYPVDPRVLEVSQGIALKDLLEGFYFREDQIGALEKMTPGLIDFESAFFIKATAYQARIASSCKFLLNLTKFKVVKWQALKHMKSLLAKCQQSRASLIRLAHV